MHEKETASDSEQSEQERANGAKNLNKGIGVNDS